VQRHQQRSQMRALRPAQPDGSTQKPKRSISAVKVVRSHQHLQGNLWRQGELGNGGSAVVVLQLVVKVLHHLFQHVARDLRKLNVATRLSEGVCTSAIAEKGRQGGGGGTGSRRSQRVPKSSRAQLSSSPRPRRRCNDDQPPRGRRHQHTGGKHCTYQARNEGCFSFNNELMFVGAATMIMRKSFASCVTPEGSALVLSNLSKHLSCNTPDKSDVLRDGRAVASF